MSTMNSPKKKGITTLMAIPTVVSGCVSDYGTSFRHCLGEPVYSGMDNYGNLILSCRDPLNERFTVKGVRVMRFWPHPASHDGIVWLR